MIEVKRSPSLEASARESRAAYERGDDSWYADHTAESGELLFYGSAPDEEFRGREAILSLTIAESRAMNDAAGISTDDEPRLECFEAGDTGWIVAHGHFGLADGSSVPTRAVTVLVRDGETWKRVFGSVHVVVPNELLTPGSPIAVHSDSTAEAAPA